MTDFTVPGSSSNNNMKVDPLLDDIKNGATNLVFAQPLGPDPKEGLTILSDVVQKIREYTKN